MGVELTTKAAGGHSTNADEVRALAQHLKANGGNGLFIWSIQKKCDGVTAAEVCGIAQEVLGVGAKAQHKMQCGGYYER